MHLTSFIAATLSTIMFSTTGLAAEPKIARYSRADVNKSDVVQVFDTATIRSECTFDRSAQEADLHAMQELKPWLNQFRSKLRTHFKNAPQGWNCKVHLEFSENDKKWATFHFDQDGLSPQMKRGIMKRIELACPLSHPPNNRPFFQGIWISIQQGRIADVHI